MRAATLAAVLLLLPSAFAGNADAPETTDPAGDSAAPFAWSDMLAAWFEDDEGTLTIAWRVAGLEDVGPGACWNLDFAVNGVPYFAVVQTGLGFTPRLSYGPADQSEIWDGPVRIEGDTLRATPLPHVVPVTAGDVVTFTWVLSCGYAVILPYDEVANGGAHMVLSRAPTNVRESLAYEGAFLAGEPVAFFAQDACTTPEAEGITSNCVALSALVVGNAATLTATDALGTVLLATACYYDAYDDFLGCDHAHVPEGAVKLGVSALGGAGVSWRLETTA